MSKSSFHRFASIGKDVTIRPLAKIVSPEVISIGNSVIIDDFVLLVGGKRTDIGSFVHIASFTSIAGGGEFIVEDFVGLSAGCRILTGTDDFLGTGLTGPTIPEKYRAVRRESVVIKKHSIIGANSVILPGVTLGEGVAVGANSLVINDCLAWTVYVGSPARVLRKRPRERILELERDLRRELYDRQGKYLPFRGRVGHSHLESGDTSTRPS